ncbi:hypothetical protein GEMRC1_010598 [Eukaryota sp. GEM-RC1]
MNFATVSMPPPQYQSAVNPLYSSQQVPQPYGNSPQYQSKNKKNLLVGIIAVVVLVVVLAVVIVIATSPSDSGPQPEPEPSFDDIVYRRVSMKLDGEEVTFDYETGMTSTRNDDEIVLLIPPKPWNTANHLDQIHATAQRCLPTMSTQSY